MATFTLDMIREAAEAQYGSLDIPLDERTTVKLLNPLRLSSEKRKELMALQSQLNGPEKVEGEEAPQATDESVAEQEELFDKIFYLIADSEVGAAKLIEALGGDLAQKAIVFEKYGEGTQAGEASASQD